MGSSGMMPVAAYGAGSSDRTVTGSPARAACRAIAATWATGQGRPGQMIASAACWAVKATGSANHSPSACAPAPGTCGSAPSAAR